MEKDHVVIYRVGNKSLKPLEHDAPTVGQWWTHESDRERRTHW